MIMGGHICSIAGCDREAEVRGMCSAHFTAALTHGVFHMPEARTLANSVAGTQRVS